MTRTAAHTLSIALVLLAVWSAPAAAQVDVAGGYASLHETDVNVPAGWFAAIGADLNQRLGVVGQVSGHYTTLTENDVDVTSSLHVFGAGPRIKFGRPALAPFAQVLVGVAHSRAQVPDVAGTEVSATSFAVQPAGGVDIAASQRVGVRLQIGETLVNAETLQKEFHVMAGVVVRRGR